MKILLHLLTAILFIAGTVFAGDYVRPPPRKTLHFPWHPKSSSQPQQVHISLAGDKHMRVTWVSNDGSSPIVEYGMYPGKYSAIAQGESTKYSYLLYSSGKIHHTVIGPLQENTTYFYRCGGEGPEFQLKTPPSKFPVTFAVAGDLGQTGWTKSTLDHIDQCKYDVHLLPGDLSYADYLQHKWDTFGQLVQPLASSRPWMVTEGFSDPSIYRAFFFYFFFLELANSQETLEETGNKGVVLALYEALSSHDVVQVQKLLASDLEWWFHGPPSHQFLMQILTGTAKFDNASFQFLPKTIDVFGSVVLVEGCDPTRSITWVHAWTVTDGVITQVREYFNTSLTVTRFGKKTQSEISSITPLHCPSVWESSLPNRVGKSVPGLVLAL